ncbi:MAG: polysaccharide chain length determinant protein (PEP-CTERM system associated) [Flavobacteriales bacterium]|jgi:polysaccharide chain length determinant protein (PEP-CTERM system associated)
MDNIDFAKEILLAIKFELIRFRVLAASLCVVVLVAVLGVGLSWQLQYESNATLAVEDSNIIQPLLRGRAQFTEGERVEEAKKDILSRAMLESVARELNYINDESSIQDVVMVLGALKRKIIVSSEGKRASSFTISYSSTDPEVSFNTIKVIADLIVSRQRQSKREEGENAYGFISRRVGVYKARLEDAENSLKDFKAGSLDIDETRVQTRLAELETTIQDLVLSVQELESNTTTTKKQLSIESEYIDAQSKIYVLKQQQSILTRQLSGLRMQFQESYPDIVNIKTQIAELDAQIVSVGEAEGINPGTIGSSENSESNPELLFDDLRKQLSDSERELKAKKERLASLRTLHAEQKQKIEFVASNQAALAELMREYNVTKEHYEEMLVRQQSAELSVAITQEGQGLTYRIIGEATFPLSPTGLTFIHFLLVAPILALGIPIGLVVAMVIVDPRIRTLGALSSGLEGGQKVLAVLPHYHTIFADRIVKKDMLVLSTVAGFVCLAYLYVAYLGLSAG